MVIFLTTRNTALCIKVIFNLSVVQHPSSCISWSENRSTQLKALREVRGSAEESSRHGTVRVFYVCCVEEEGTDWFRSVYVFLDLDCFLICCLVFGLIGHGLLVIIGSGF
jgi:hypothetical protein